MKLLFRLSIWMEMIRLRDLLLINIGEDDLLLEIVEGGQDQG